VLARPPAWRDGYELAVVSTDLATTPAALVERYSHRWTVEVLFEESRQVMGVGQARNRTRKAVERTVPFGLVSMSLAVCWYALPSQPAADIAARHARAPWYRTKHTPSLADMLTALRRELLTAQFSAISPAHAHPPETLQAQVAWSSPQHDRESRETRRQAHSRHCGTNKDYSLTAAQKSNSPGP
jgi:hypothetical protein